MSDIKTMKPKKKRTQLERIMKQICRDFGEFGIQEEVSFGLGINPPRIYFNFIENKKKNLYYLKGSEFTMKDTFDMVKGYKLILDSKRKPHYKDDMTILAFDLKKLEEGEKGI